MSLRKKSLVYLLGGVVAAGGNVLLAPFYLRALDATDFGLWSRFQLLLQIFQPLLGWGTMAAMTRLLADATPERRGRQVAAAIRLVTALNATVLVAASLGLLFGDALQAAGLQRQYPLAVAAMGAAALAAYPSILLGVRAADGDAVRYRALGLLGFCAQVAAFALAARLARASAVTVILAFLGSSLLYAGVSLAQLRAGARGTAGRDDYRALLSFGVPIVLYTVAAQSSDLFTRALLGTRATAAEFGAFSACQTYASIVSMASSAVNLAWAPIFYRNAGRWAGTDTYRRFADAASGAMAICGGFLSIFSRELVRAFSGGRVAAPVPIVALLVMAAWMNSAVWTGLANPMFERKRSREVMLISLASTLCCAPVTWWLVRGAGTTGAASALAVGAFATCAIAALAVRALKLPATSHGKSIVLLALMLAASLASDALAARLPFPPLVTEIAVFCMYASIAYLVSVRPGLPTLRLVEAGAA
jgi:O-antigen/teichoic acid export membrane protein